MIILLYLLEFILIAWTCVFQIHNSCVSPIFVGCCCSWDGILHTLFGMSDYLSYCCPSIIWNQSAHSPLTSDLNNSFLSTQLLLTGYLFFFGPFSVNPGDVTLNWVTAKLHEDRESQGSHTGLERSLYPLHHVSDPKIDQQGLIISSVNCSDSPETMHSPTVSVSQQPSVPVGLQLQCIVVVIK